MALTTPSKFTDFIKKSKHPLVATPEHFDIDTIGGALALFLALKKMGKNPEIASSGAMPKKFQFLPGREFINRGISNEYSQEISLETGEKEIDEIYYDWKSGSLDIHFRSRNCEMNKDSVKVAPPLFRYDLVLAIGSPDLDSLGPIYKANQALFSKLPIINIDYKRENKLFGDINIIPGNCRSNSEAAAEIIESDLFGGINKEIATVLLAGIIGRTGNFTKKEIEAKTFYLAALLLSKGAKRDEILSYFYKKTDFYFLFDKLGQILNSPSYSKEEIKNIILLLSPKQKLALVLFLSIIASGIFIFEKPKIAASFSESIGLLQSNSIFRQLEKSLFSVSSSFDFSGFSIKRDENDAIEGENYNLAPFNPFSGGLNRSFPERNSIFSASKSYFGEMKTKTSILGDEDKHQEIGFPERIIIPKIGVDAAVQYVGLTPDGDMDAPNNAKDAAWFKLGPKPAEEGNAVIAGHFDSKDGKPALFWDLDKLSPGDYIFIIDDKSVKRRFKVIERKFYDSESASMEEIFGASDKARLNLITCGGVWDKKTQNYNKRLVVFSEYDPL